MSSEINGLREFGKFRLEAEKKVLWFDGEPVNLPLKEIELLCVLTENGGEVVTKEELLNRVWADSFVEESNLSRHIYRLRKRFEELGAPSDLIQTVPRRGYRFTGELRESGDGELIIERHSLTKTLVEELDISAEPNGKPAPIPTQIYSPRASRLLLPALVLATILMTAFGWYFYNRRAENSSAAAPIKSIAVLPLKSFSATAENEELGWRITDALITKLGGLNDLAVRPTASVLRFSKSERSIFEIGKTLEVDAVLDGRIQQEGAQIRVTLQLFSVADGAQLWSETFDGNSGKILELQDAISLKVLQSVNQARPQNLEFAARPTQNEDAFAAYLKGRYFASRSDVKSLRKAIEFFQQAVALDPQFAEGFAGIAEINFRLFQGDFDNSTENVVLAKANLEKALALNPYSAEALQLLGHIQNSYDWDWESAEKTGKRAIELAPQSPGARVRYSFLLVGLRRFDEAQGEIEQAVRLNPTAPGLYTNLGIIYFCRKDFAKAEELFKKSLELDEKWVFAHWYLSRAIWFQGRRAESLKYVVSGLHLDGNAPLAQKIEEKARREEPEAVIRFLIEEWTTKPPLANPISVATRAISLDEREKALDYLEKAFAERHPWSPLIAALPDFEPLRDEARFKAIVRKMNLPE